MTARYIVGDTRAVTATLPDGSVDFIMCSPPFLALRSYLPADHPDKAAEIGSEATPAEFIDVMLELSAEWRRVLAPHGSIVVELGDTYSGSGGAGGDYGENGLRAGQDKFDGSARRRRIGEDTAWPRAKSLVGIPERYRLSLIDGVNICTGQPSPAGRWQVRNVIRWVRPNPPVGALGKKWRPATSDLVVACPDDDNRYWDDVATRVEHLRSPDGRQLQSPTARTAADRQQREAGTNIGGATGVNGFTNEGNPAGAPLLDWWKIVPKGYEGAHYAVYPPELCTAPIDAMCPRRVCRTCGRPSVRLSGFDSSKQSQLAAHIRERRQAAGLSVETVNGWLGYVSNVQHWESTNQAAARIPSVEDWPLLKERLGLSDEFDDLVSRWSAITYVTHGDAKQQNAEPKASADYIGQQRQQNAQGMANGRATKVKETTGWTTCGHPGTDGLRLDGFHDGPGWRPGIVYDPFAGTGTTLAVATGMGRDAIGADLDPRNADLALERVGPLLLTVETLGEVAA